MSIEIIQKGSSGVLVTRLQNLLIANGYKLVPDGVFGGVTESAVMGVQGEFGLTKNGIVGPDTWAALEKIYQEPMSTEIPKAIWSPLFDGQYSKYKTNKIGVTLHHTVSNGNPKNVIASWNRDDRGRVGTHFVIGRDLIHGKDGVLDSRYNGQIVQCFGLDFWNGHLGMTIEKNRELNEGYIGIELCSAGSLELTDGGYYSKSLGALVKESEVCKISFRGYNYWHKYTEGQLQSLEYLLKELKRIFNFDYSKNLPEDFFNLDWNAFMGLRTLTTHTNFRHDKTDCFPQPELLEVIKNVTK